MDWKYIAQHCPKAYKDIFGEEDQYYLYSDRDLYEIFDGHGIKIEIMIWRSDGEFYFNIVGDERDNEGTTTYASRKTAEEEAFKRAFEIREHNLSTTA